MSHPEDIIAEMSRAIESIRSEETGGCFKPSEADQQGECADHDCYCARQCDEAARACWAVVSKHQGWTTDEVALRVAQAQSIVPPPPSSAEEEG